MLIDELSIALSRFRGSKCWNVLSCTCAHSLRFSFGQALESARHSLRGTEKKKLYRGQYELYIICSWRLEDPVGNPLLSSACDYEYIKANAICFLGDTFDSFTISKGIADAAIVFTSGRRLKIFCDFTCDANDPSGGTPNWHCYDEEYVYFLRCEKRITRALRDGVTSKKLYNPGAIELQYLYSDLNYAEKGQLLRKPFFHQDNNLQHEQVDRTREHREILTTLQKFIGQQCRKITPCYHHDTSKSDYDFESDTPAFLGVALDIDFGNEVKTNPLEQDADGKSLDVEGEYKLIVWCRWRVDDDDHGICGSFTRESECVKELNKLIGTKIISIETSPPQWDATITFSSGRTLRVFCDQLPYFGLEYSNWDFADRTVGYCIGPGSYTRMRYR